MSRKDTITGIILAGGASKRLNYKNKALLKIGGRSIIEHIINALSKVTESIVLSTNSPEQFEHLGLPTFKDITPGSGSLGGIYTGLKISRTHHNLIIACDIPFIRSNFLKLLVNSREDYDVVVPVTPDGHQPTCAIYSRNCLIPIEAQIDEGNLKISDLFPSVKVKRIDCYDSTMFFNINTHEDYLVALSMAIRYRDQE